MTETPSRLLEEYRAAFQEYLHGAGEAALERAYELGRKAVDYGLGVLDVATIYQEMLAEALQSPNVADTTAVTKAAATFLAECLSPFEMTHRSYRDANAALRASEERYRGLFENANDIVFTADLKGSFTSINRAGEEITGYRRDELSGMSFGRLFAPEYVELVRQMLDRKLRSGGKTTYEAEIITKDGRRVTLDVSTRLAYQEGRPGGVQGIARDITERKRAERVFRDLLEAAPDGMVVIDKERKMVLLNAQTEKLFGYRREELLGKDLNVLVPERFRERHAAHCAQFLTEGQLRPMGTGLVLSGLRKDGSEFPAEISLSPLETAEGTVVLSAIRDITVRKRAEEALQRMNEALEEQTRRIAHALHDESGQLLAAVHIALQEMAGDLPSSARKPLQNVRRMLDQIEEQIREFSHELRPPVLEDLGFARALEFLGQRVSRRTRISVTVKCGKDERFPPPVETALYRIIQETLTNVTRHAKASKVNIQIQRDAKMIRGSVKDDGIGFDVSAVLARKGRRSGLGLTGIRTRLEALGGNCTIRSSRGHGTEILFTIPLGENDASPCAGS